MKLYIPLLWLLVMGALTQSGYAQTYGNEWINYSQSYYRIPIVRDGVYRITYNNLVSAGISTSAFDARQLQIIHEGEEQYIFVYGENDGVFGPGDYIEFLGYKNDGSVDAAIYNNPVDQPNPYYSLFNDTAVYFLTWNTSMANRRMSLETDKDFTGYTPENYVIQTVHNNYTSEYYAGETDDYQNTDPRYTNTEGWFSAEIKIDDEPFYTFNVLTQSVYDSGPDAYIRMKMIGASDYAGLSPDHHLRVSFAGVTVDTTYEGYVPFFISRSISPSDLGDPSTSFTFTLPDDLGSGADRNALAYLTVTYPRSTDLNGLSDLFFASENGALSKAYFQFNNVGSAITDSVLIYDISNHKRILTQRSGSQVKALIPNAATGSKNCFLFTNAAVLSVMSIKPVNSDATNLAKFINYADPQYSDVDYIIVTHSSLLQKANEYAVYRAGTGYETLVADASMLYDQFAFGVRKHPLGIRNFALYAQTVFADTIHGLFLMGKAARAGDYSFNYRTNSVAYQQTLVPSFGNPPSDVLLTSGLDDANYTPTLPTGRLAARNPTHIDWYLTKMIDYESELQIPYNPADPLEGAWKKKVLHFAGGSSWSEGQYLLSLLNQYRDTVMAPYFGADVKTFTKTSTAPIQQNQSDSLKNLINDGVILLNFFGHAAGIGFDISLDNPAEYSNYKRYPFLVANSCYAGDLYLSEVSSSEAFVLIENKGTIGYLGSISKSLAPYLHIYSKELIGRISKRDYGKPIGEIIQKTIATVENTVSEHYLRDICLEMTLHGDPVLRLASMPQPDFVLTQAGLYFNPSTVTTDLDSFHVNVVASNVGMAVSDSVILELTRIFPDNTQEVYQKMIPSPAFADTIVFSLPVNPINGVGLNSFKAEIDAFNSVSESVETNNIASSVLYVVSNDINPVYPYEYAVIPDTFVTLVASTGYAMAQMASYVFQIDTTDSFDSPFMQQSNPISQNGGIVEWNVPFSMLTLPDSTVYFWRVSATSTGLWRESSFQYITGKRGWGQAHFYQYKNDNFEYVSYNKPSRLLEFINSVVTITAMTGYFPYIQWSEIQYRVDNVIKGQWSCTDYNGNGMKFAVFDTLGVEPWSNTDPDLDGFGPYGSINCRNYEFWDFDFSSTDFTWKGQYITDDQWFQRMTDMLNAVPDGYYMLALSHRNHNAENFPDTLYEAFESFGSSLIRLIPNNVPYIFFGRKGDPSVVDERVGGSINDIISGSWGVNTNWKEGFVESTVVGPASEWGSLHWRVRSNEAGLWTDTVRLFVLGIRADGSIDTLIRNLPPVIDSLDILNLDARIDAAEFPMLKLHLKMSDDSLRTPAQLERWQVLYEPVPETAIDPLSLFNFYNDTIQEGESIRLAIATRNVGTVDFPDSLKVAYWLLDNDRNIHQIARKTLRMHPVGDVLIDSVSFSTQGFGGFNSLWVEFNPADSVTGQYDQLEQYHFNNIAEIKFLADKDRINPMLDVTFDGIHILDGDIVSAQPVIEIMLKDENQYLLLDDTSAFRIYLQRPGSSNLERIYFYKGGVEQMQFYPSSSSGNNTARITYPAGMFSDGMYQLMVQARDRSDNESGSIDYKINFEVINKPAITDVMNWPNPFSTKTHFVFTLTGSEVPEFFTIQIMTVNGKVVREISREELGNIHIGRNITEYAWDGRDEYGDQLANGVYLYRVMIRLNGQSMERIETKAGDYFVKEFGKMVLIR